MRAGRTFQSLSESLPDLEQIVFLRLLFSNIFVFISSAGGEKGERKNRKGKGLGGG